MKSRLLSVLIVLLALAAGWGVRSWRQERARSRAVSAGDHQSPASPRSPSSHPAPEEAEKPLPALTGLSAQLTQLRTAAECEAAFATLLREPMDDVALEAQPVPWWELLFNRWTELEPEAALAAANSLPQRQLGMRLVQLVIERWVEKDRAGLLAALDRMPLGWASNMGRWVAFGALGQSDPAGAMQLIESLPNGRERDEQVASVLRGWAEKEPEAALAWVLAQPDGATRQENLERLLANDFSFPAERSWELIRQHVQDPTRRKNMLNGMIMRQAQGEPAETVQRILTLPAAERTALLYTAGEWSYNQRKNPERVAELDALLPATGPEREAWTAGCARGFLLDGETPNPPAALALIQQLPPGEQRASLLKETGEVWAKRDAVTASEFFNAQPPSADRDTMLGEYVRAHFSNDPEAALIWSTAITDAGKRSRRLEDLLPKWHARDTAAAESWINDSAHLQPAERAALLERARAR